MATVYEELNIKGKNLLKAYLDNKNLLLEDYSRYNDSVPYSARSSAEILATAGEDSVKVFEEAGNDFDAFFKFADYISDQKAGVGNMYDRWIKQILPTTALDTDRYNFEQRTKRGDTLKKKWDKEKFSDVQLGVGEGNLLNQSKYISNTTYEDSLRNTESYVYTPTEDDVVNAAKTGKNLGQIKGLEVSQNKNNAAAIRTSLYYDLIGGIISLDVYNQEIDRIVVGKTWRPVPNRIPEPKPRKYSLDQILTQNTLKAKEGKSKADVFRELYLNNPAKDTSKPTLRDGIIAGVGVRELEEPVIDSAGNVNSNKRKVHNFSEDSKRLMTDRQDKGFTSNIDVSSNKLQPAVYNTALSVSPKAIIVSADGNKYEAGALESVGLSENQFFPFLFETVNRHGDGNFKQYCSLQAAILQNQEAYNPNWSAKHFFGRTEEIFTYTHTSRSIDLRFVVFAVSARELQNVYERTNWLAQQCYPSLGTLDGTIDAGVKRMKGGPLIAITIGDQWSRVAGYIRSLNFNWDHSGPGGKWEMTRGLRMVQSCEVSLSYQVIHNNSPHRNTDFYRGLQAGLIDQGQALITTTTDSDEFNGKKEESYVNLMRRVGGD